MCGWAGQVERSDGWEVGRDRLRGLTRDRLSVAMEFRDWAGTVLRRELGRLAVES
jgi:hypothetical protein